MKLICLLVLSFSSFLTYGHRLEYEPVEFLVGSSKCFVLDANSSNQNKPWVWYAPTLPAHPDPSHRWYIDKLLKKGISFAGCDQGEVRGSPKSVGRFTKFYNEMVDRGYSKKPILLGQSRGGLMMLSWAVKNPKKVKAFAGIYPVLNLRSWPMTRNLSSTLADFEMDQDTFLKTVDLHNPIHQLEGLAQAKVPLFMVHGDSDRIVPLEENTEIVINRYSKLGGEAEVKIVLGKGHQVGDDFFKSKELIEFIIQHSNH
ncbi:S9 family peptidase [Opitutales bacterium]|nr:S9 family peptidase [Opitutales bacterium]MDA8990194.1 S9 family peptidase [Opitutales bacterium]